MITTITTTLVTPFMVATATEAPATPAPQIEAVAYDWSSQNATEAEENSGFDCGATASFCFAPGAPCGTPQVVDDWHLA